jgi:hypothetical protein
MKIPLNELTDAAVSHISLVDRGANREPFRIIKAEGDMKMLDFSKGFQGLFTKSEDRPAAIVAVAFSKQFDPKAAAEILGEAGLSFGDAVSTDAALTFPIGDATAEDVEGALIFKISDDVAAAIRYDEPETVRKGYTGYDFESTDFKTVVGTNKSLPMIGVAMSGLQDVVWNIMSNSDTVEVAKSDIKKALKDFSGMVLGIVDNIPATAFKLEAAVQKAAAVKKTENGDPKADTTTKGEDAPKKDEPAPTGQTTEELERRTNAEPTEAEKEGEAATIDAPKDGEAGDKGEKTAAKKGEGEAQADPPAEAPALDVTAIAAAVMKGLEPKLTEMGSQLASFGETVTALKKEVATNADSLKKVDDSLNLGIVGGDQDEAGADENSETVHKVDLQDGEEANDEGFLVLDTGFQDPFPEFKDGRGRQAH